MSLTALAGYAISMGESLYQAAHIDKTEFAFNQVNGTVIPKELSALSMCSSRTLSIQNAKNE